MARSEPIKIERIAVIGASWAAYFLSRGPAVRVRQQQELDAPIWRPGGLRRFRWALFPAYTFQPLMLWSRCKLAQCLEVGLAIVHHVQGDCHGFAIATIQ